MAGPSRFASTGPAYQRYLTARAQCLIKAHSLKSQNPLNSEKKNLTPNFPKRNKKGGDKTGKPHVGSLASALLNTESVKIRPPFHPIRGGSAGFETREARPIRPVAGASDLVRILAR